MKKTDWKKVAPWIGMLVLTLVGAYFLIQQRSQRTPSRDISYSELLAQIDEGRVHDVTIAGEEITGHFNDGTAFNTLAPEYHNLVKQITEKKVSIKELNEENKMG